MSEYIEREAALANKREYNLGGSYDNTELAVPVNAINSIPAAEVLEISGLNEKGRRLLAYCPDAVNTLAAYLEEAMDQTVLYGPKGSARPEPFNVADMVVVVSDGPSRTPAPTEAKDVPLPCPFCGVHLSFQGPDSLYVRWPFSCGEECYMHPYNGCIASGAQILKHRLSAWNKRI